MILNWGLEVYKWRYFTIKIKELTFLQSIKSILIGIIAGIFTPNRLGELGGRLLYINSQHRSSAIYINSLCSISQLIATLIFGLLAFTVINEKLDYFQISSFSANTLSYLLIGIILFIYFKGNVLRKIILKLNTMYNNTNATYLLRFTTIDRVKLLILSILRYFVFCIQFILLLFIFIPELSFSNGLISACSIFLLTTIIPSGWISDLPVRTTLAFIIIEFIGYSGAYGSMASIILWVINLFFPALVGLAVIKDVKWRQQHGK